MVRRLLTEAGVSFSLTTVKNVRPRPRLLANSDVAVGLGDGRRNLERAVRALAPVGLDLSPLLDDEWVYHDRIAFYADPTT